MKYVMKRVLPAVVVLSAVFGAAGTAQAGCNARCLNHRIDVLSSRINTDTRVIGVLVGCLEDLPITQYGDQATGTFGYGYDPGDGTTPYLTSALDATNGTDHVGAWVLGDKCNTATTAAARDVRGARDAFHAIAPLGAFPAPVRK